MLLSIIIPTLNEAAYIEKTVRSLQYLRSNHCEIIIADGGSDDDTCQRVQPWVDKTIICRKGRARQMNAGTKSAKGEWLLFLHADTLLPADIHNLFEQFAPLNQDWGFFSLRLSGKQALLKVIAYCINWRSRLTKVATGDQCIFVRHDIFKKIQGFKDIPLMEDVVISKTLRNVSAPLFVRQAVVTSSRRWQSDGIIKTILFMWWLRLQFFLGANPVSLVKKYYG